MKKVISIHDYILNHKKKKQALIAKKIALYDELRSVEHALKLIKKHEIVYRGKFGHQSGLVDY